MATYFEEKKWDTLVTSKPDWYLDIAPELKKLLKSRENLKDDEYKRLKIEIYSFFEKQLEEGRIVLGNSGKNYDKEREPITTIVIHHTHNEPGLTISRLNAIHFTNLYIAHYAEPRYKKEKHIKGDPIWSGHFSKGKQVFYAYHWLVRMNGTVERLLDDSEIGWQAGNWGVNKRSVAICLDNDYTNETPSKEVIRTTAELIKKHYPSIPQDNIVGHKEINLNTECPGNTFLGGWKAVLTGMV